MDGTYKRDLIFQDSAAAFERCAHRAVTIHNGSPEDMMLVAIHVDDPEWRSLVDHLMPDNEAEWQSYRDAGMLPIARGTVTRDLLELVSTMVPALSTAVNRQPTAGSMYALVLAEGGASLYEVPCPDVAN